MARVISVRLDDELAVRLDQLAAALDRPRAWLIKQAITRHLDQDAEQVQAVSNALAAYQQGEDTVHPHQQVMERLEQRLHRARR